MKREYNGSSIFDKSEDADGGFCLEDLVRSAAQRMIHGALEMEVTEFLGRLPGERGEEGFRGYRNGYLPERKVATSVGTLYVRQPRVSDVPEETGGYGSKILRPYKRRSTGLDELFPKLFVEGLATRDFEPALRALVGEDAPLSPSAISRLNKQFAKEFDEWRERPLDGHEFLYVWADGVYLKAGLADEKLCALVIIGADRLGKKHLLALGEGYRESKQSWLDVLRDLKARGMNAPAIAIADGGLGFWAAVPEVWPHTGEQLCWLHKTRNILDKLPKREQKESAERLRAVYLAKEEGGDTARQNALKLAGSLMNDWKEAGYTAAAECFEKAMPRLFTFLEFPVEHARHLRTTNPVESPFATVRLRTNAVRRMKRARPALHLVFKLLMKAERNWQTLSHPEKLKEVKLPDRIT